MEPEEIVKEVTSFSLADILLIVNNNVMTKTNRLSILNVFMTLSIIRCHAILEHYGFAYVYLLKISSAGIWWVSLMMIDAYSYFERFTLLEIVDLEVMQPIIANTTIKDRILLIQLFITVFF